MDEYNPAPSRGAMWNRWDLHVHTPESVEQHYGSREDQAVWDKYIEALASLSPDIKAVGICDYNTIDGYKKVISAKADGRLPNLKLILPIIELRLSHLAGHGKLQKVNLHVVFSDQLSTEDIEIGFLKSIQVKEFLVDGTPHRASISGIGDMQKFGAAIRASTPEDKRDQSESDLDLGFRSVCYDLADIQKKLEETRFENKYLLALGKAEWDQMRWDGAGAVQKKTLSNLVAFKLTACESVGGYESARSALMKNGVNSHLIHASDAHYYSDSDQPMRLGNTMTWIKSDLTFNGFVRAIRCFDDRVFIGPLPEKVQTTVPMHCLERISIRKIPGSDCEQTWFDVDMPLNPGLIAIIGNQGKGKSAFTDILALCGNAIVNPNDLGFLVAEKFKDRNGYAQHFEATVSWSKSDKSSNVNLTDDSDELKPEMVKYVTQRFFENVTNETHIRTGGLFYSEIKKVLFSHIEESDRLGCATLDDLIELKTKNAQTEIAIFRKELSDLNKRIAGLQQEILPCEIEKIDNLIGTKKLEVSDHCKSQKPDAVIGPSVQTETEEGMERLRTAISDLESQITENEEKRKQLKHQIEIVEQTLGSISTLESTVNSQKENLQHDLEVNGIEDISIDDVVSLTIDKDPLSGKGEQLKDQLKDIESKLSTEGDENQSLVVTKSKREDELKLAEDGLKADRRAYQQYLEKLREWKTQLARLVGTPDASDSLRGTVARKRQLNNKVPKELKELEKTRLNIVRKIHGKKLQILQDINLLIDPVRKKIEENDLTREVYRMGFLTHLRENNFPDGFFDRIVRNRGSFRSQVDGETILNDLISRTDFMDEDGLIDFAEEVAQKIVGDVQSCNTTSDLFKRNKTLNEFYDYLFGLDYLEFEFGLSLDGKPLQQLSPGQRGILLLIFYLIIDRSTCPLIIDQPEGNLNNQSIYENLVPVFKEAKKRRQIIVVTHNPNLAVVCDAEQVIHSDMITEDGDIKIVYTSGALENSRYRDLSLDLLEGTSAAFGVRANTYQDGLR